MRLTLRTLLAYLDDTLPSAEIKQIGEKVAESDAAQELISRIKQVTRRRRLTTPPVAGPGAFDPNDVADYLDNALPSDQVAELEKQCLESDVHLAEIAACHQILTLVLGEPALVPPTARERMYGLVKGKESIPYRKAAAVKKPSEDGLEDEETLGLSGGWLRWVLPVAGLLLLVALGLAIYQIVPDGKDSRRASADRRAKDDNAGPRDGEANRDADRTAKKDGTTPADKDREKDRDRGTPPGKDRDRDRGVPGEKDNGKPPERDRGKDGDKDRGKDGGVPSVGRRLPPSKESAVVARYQGAFTDLPGVLLKRKAGSTSADDWEKVKRGTSLQSTDTLLSLPGFANVVQTTTGVSLLLRGNVREYALTVLQRDFLMGSAAVLHRSKEHDLDMTLLRGRIYLTNRKDSGPAKIRLRFEEREAWDITLSEPGDQVGVDLFKVYSSDINHRADEEPRAYLFLVLIRGEATIRVNDVDEHTRRARAGRAYMFGWDSFKRASEPRELDQLPPSWSKAPPTPEEVGERIRDVRRMTVALKDLEARLSSDKKVNIAIKEGLTKEDPMARVMSIYCLGEIDDLGNLIDVMGDEELTHGIDRSSAIYTLRRWLARGAGQRKVLFDENEKKGEATGVLLTRINKVSDARTISDLLFDLPVENWRKPETFEALARCLRSPRVAIAELGYSHLLHLARGVKLPPFNAADSLEERKKFAELIDNMVEKKQLPPPLPERKEEPKPGPKDRG